MVPELSDKNAAFPCFVDDPVFRIDPARPVSTKRVFQRLRLTHTGMRIPYDIFEEFVDSSDDLWIRRLPESIVLPSLRRKS